MGSGLRTELAQDPHGTGWLSLFDKSKGCEIHWGQVVDCLPFANAYRVCCGARSYIWCSDSAISGYAPFGARQLNTIPIGSLVFYVNHPQVPWFGTIIGVQPAPMMSLQHFRSDYISAGGHSGIRVDACHQFTLKQQTDGGGSANWSSGRPVDQTSIGEWGAITESGLSIFLDPFMAHMRVDEATGLFLFLHDQLTRLSGHNLQIRSSVSEREDLDDESEISRLEGTALHYLEGLGYLRPGATLSRSYSGEAVQGKQSMFNVLEPAQDDQQPFHRLQEARGYLGQGFRRTLNTLPTSGTLNRYQTESVLPGLFEESLSATGAYSLSSAKHIILSKRPSVVPKMIKRPEDTSGDTADNYNASGGLNDQELHSVADEMIVPEVVDPAVPGQAATLAAGVAAAASGTAAAALIQSAITGFAASHSSMVAALTRIKARIELFPTDVMPHLAAFSDIIEKIGDAFPTAGDGEEPPANLVRAAAVLDLGAFDFNWTGTLHPYYYHSRDWYLPEEGDLPMGSFSLPSFASLSSSQYLNPPAATNLQIDHRYGIARYFPNHSVIAMLDDGGIVIGDGYGAEIRLSGGTVQISAPGDIWLQSGKNVNTWAGWDAIVKALNSIDLTASRKDVRLKAEHNVMILGGNDLCGGVLIESRADCAAYDYTDKIGEEVITSGIILRAPTSQVVSWGRDVILWADPQESDTPGHIVLDSGNRIKAYCKYFDRFIRRSAYDIFVNDEGVTEKVNEFWVEAAIYGTDLRTAGSLQTCECLWVNGNVIVSDGHIVTENTANYRYMIPKLEGDDLAAAAEFAVATTDRINNTASVVGAAEYNAGTWRQDLFDSLGTAIYSLRNAEQYRTTELILFETRWQQLARVGGSGVPTWVETEVDVNGDPTYPHPGLGPWTGTDESSNPVFSFYRQDLSLHSISSGRSVSRASNQVDYETPAHPRATPASLAGNYRVIMTS